ncbi:AraC family transcriptional regulator [Pseudomonas oryzihabitans]|uniref:AraC family transcriptional regulator n=1 Tax=Pseudomonas oryzihabitans TaxID=47885 RepID=UPI00135D1072|nr:AraC family transcriptional regulator [Pseudomonas oryzihabitans]MXS18346.1 helix-turn-helix domain-containing protein [Pseudomonas oryzihabitans]
MSFSSASTEWLLDNLECDASLFHAGRYCGGWQASTQGQARASFHLVVEGQCWLHLGDEAVQPLASGDAIFLLHDLPFRLASSAHPTEAGALPRGAMGALSERAGEGTGLVCGFFDFAGSLSRLIVSALPAIIVLRAGDQNAQAARTLFQLIREEASAPRSSAALLARLGQLLFLYVLRDQLNHSERGHGGLVALARHAQFGPLLEQLIAAPERPWSLVDMAAVTGLSRSAFCKKFQEIGGQSPGQVLLALRMRRACLELDAGQRVEAVAERVGYHSVAAFVRAFAKEQGLPPGAYRRRKRDGCE